MKAKLCFYFKNSLYCNLLGQVLSFQHPTKTFFFNFLGKGKRKKIFLISSNLNLLGYNRQGLGSMFNINFPFSLSKIYGGKILALYDYNRDCNLQGRHHKKIVLNIINNNFN